MAKSDQKKRTPPSQPQDSPWPKRLLLAGGAVALILLIVVVVQDTLSAPGGGIPEGTQVVDVGAPTHVEGPIYEPNEVPAGGQHNSIWANCGYYDTPVPAENAVHSMEHGAVWISYEPDLDGDQIDTLRGLSRPAEKVLISPVEGQGSPIIATAWGHQLELADTDDPRLDQFVTEFAGSLEAPEPGGACSGGVGNPVG